MLDTDHDCNKSFAYDVADTTEVSENDIDCFDLENYLFVTVLPAHSVSNTAFDVARAAKSYVFDES